MSEFELVLPADFADYEWEVTAKGHFSDARMTISGKSYCLNFYDTARLGQDMAYELERGGLFFVPNLVVVQAVTRSNMEAAAKHLSLPEHVDLLAEI